MRAQAPLRATLYSNGRIIASEGPDGRADALLEKGGRVIAVGNLRTVGAHDEAKGALQIDLRGATVVPGLQDAHGHLESYGAALEQIDLRGARTFAEVIERVQAESKRVKEGTWLRGRGWDQNLWPDTTFPHHLLLSSAVPKHPVFLERVDGHAALVNEMALIAAKLNGELDPEPKVPGGRVFVGEDGYATGMLLDAAMGLVESVIPEPDNETRVRRFLKAQETLLTYGLTCVHDMGTSRPMIKLLQDLRAQKKLELRVVSYLTGNGPWRSNVLAGLPIAPDPLDLFCVPGVKFLADGALGSRGAALLEDYSDAPGERGLLLLSEEELKVRLVQTASAGLQPAVHAIGDRANRLVLDCYEKVGIAIPTFRDTRPRIEHAQVVSPRDWPRFPELGVVPSMQPTHATSDMPWVRLRLGEERTKGAYAWRALAPEIGKLAFGSDFPVESPDPIKGLYAARTRTVEDGKQALLPEQSLDGMGALVGFTSGAAYAARQEDRRGRLLPGYACDMTVFDIDPTTCDPKALLKARVLLTVINGRIVYRAR